MNIFHWLIVIGITLLAFSLRRFTPLRFMHPEKSQAQRRWEWVGVPIVVLWGLASITLGNGILKGRITDHLQLVISVSAVALLGIAMIWWNYRWLMEADEMIRKLETEALALGFGLSIVALAAADQLRSAGIGLDTSAWTPGMAFWMVLFFGYGIARVVVYLRHR